MLEHPPVLVRHLVAGLFAGRRWDLAKRKAALIARNAVAGGLVRPPKEVCDLLGAERPAGRRGGGRKGRGPRGQDTGAAAAPPAHPAHQQQQQPPAGPPTALALRPDADSAAVVFKPPVVDALAAVASTPRLVRFDVLDCTFGAGHHSCAALEFGDPYSRVVALECDAAAPEVRRAAAEAKANYGERRFKLFGNRMSQALGMFGARAFDAVMIDPGPRMEQVTDPARGFPGGSPDEPAPLLDMRYGPHLGAGGSALELLNSADPEAIADACAYYGGFPLRVQLRVARDLRSRRPFGDAREALGALEAALEAEVPDDPWFCLTGRGFRSASPAARVLHALRGAVNAEYSELSAGLRDSMLMLQVRGRLAVVARLPWEHDLVKAFAKDHPFAALVHSEPIPPEEAVEFSQPRDTVLYVLERGGVAEMRAVRTMQADAQQLVESNVRRMYGLEDAVAAGGFPANRFTAAEFRDEEERARLPAQRRGGAAGEAPPMGRTERTRLSDSFVRRRGRGGRGR